MLPAAEEPWFKYGFAEPVMLPADEELWFKYGFAAPVMLYWLA